MPQGRKYSEEEIARIFEDAANEDASKTSAKGLSLSELKEIGTASGLSEAAIARAAYKLDHSFSLNPRKKFLGKTVRVGGGIQLGGRMSSESWSRLLAQLRSVFDAQGEVIEDRGIREWRNGNLRVIVSTADEEDILRMTTLNERKRSMRGVFAAFAAVGGFLVLMSFIGVFFESGFSRIEGVSHFFELLFNHNDASGALAVGVMQLVAGLVGLNFNGKNLKEWASEREEQMQKIGESVSVKTEKTREGLLEGLNYDSTTDSDGQAIDRRRNQPNF